MYNPDAKRRGHVLKCYKKVSLPSCILVRNDYYIIKHQTDAKGGVGYDKDDAVSSAKKQLAFIGA